MDSNKNYVLKKGVSLVEVITGFGIFGIISLMVITVYIAYFKIFSNQTTSIDLNSENRAAIDEIISQIRQGEAITSTCAGCLGDTTGSTVLVVRLWPLNASSEPTDPVGTNYDYVVYKQNAANTKELIKKIVPAATSTRPSLNKVMAVNTQTLLFEYDNADPTQSSEVTVTLTSVAASFNKTHTVTQTGKAILRNK